MPKQDVIDKLLSKLYYNAKTGLMNATLLYKKAKQELKTIKFNDVKEWFKIIYTNTICFSIFIDTIHINFELIISKIRCLKVNTTEYACTWLCGRRHYYVKS